MRRGRDAPCANVCPIATAPPAPNCWRRSAIAPTGCRAKRCPHSPTQLIPIGRSVIGLLSGSFRAHPVGWLTVAGLETLDPGAFAVVCLAQNELAGLDGAPLPCRGARVARCRTHERTALAVKARDLGIDILIDLGGYGEAGRMAACAYRLAPVQMKWVGMQNHSTGLAGDGLDHHRPLGDARRSWSAFYSERLLRLPDGYVCYSPPPYAPDVAPLPALANGHITFGCFNNLAKITPRVIATWCTILHRVPTARLVLKTHQFADAPTRGAGARRVRRTRHRAGSDGAARPIGPSGVHRRVQRHRHRAGPVPLFRRPDHLRGAVDGRADCDVPGEIFASRHSMSHLSNAGLADWVAPDVAAYVELAVRRRRYRRRWPRCAPGCGRRSRRARYAMRRASVATWVLRCASPGRTGAAVPPSVDRPAAVESVLAQT